MSTNRHEMLAVNSPEEKDYSRWAPTCTEGWQLKAPRRKRMSTNQHWKFKV